MQAEIEGKAATVRGIPDARLSELVDDIDAEQRTAAEVVLARYLRRDA